MLRLAQRGRPGSLHLQRIPGLHVLDRRAVGGVLAGLIAGVAGREAGGLAVLAVAGLAAVITGVLQLTIA